MVLGTAQLGMVYGVANRMGRPDAVLSSEIVQAAWEGGIREFDTAQAYGDSEAVLGKSLRKFGIEHEAKIISKLHPEIDHTNQMAVVAAVQNSLERLGIPQLSCLMIHREEHLRCLDQGLQEILLNLVQESMTGCVGASVYAPHRALEVIKSSAFQAVQVPANVMDRGMERAGVFEEAKKFGKKIYIRSVFLQGLLLMPLEELSEVMAFARPALELFVELARECGLTTQQAAIGYVRSRHDGARAVIGAESPEQVRANCETWAADVPEALLIKADELFGEVEERVINPRLWPS